MFVACEKDQGENLNETLSESELKFKTAQQMRGSGISSPFDIISAGIWDDNLYLTVTYIGGEYGHEYNVTWDGEVIENDNKKLLELKISDATEDNGTQQVSDSLWIKLSELNISDAIFNDKDLWFKITNSSNESNNFTVKANKIETPSDPGNGSNNNNDQTTKNIKVIAVKDDCEMGIWKGLWLKSLEENNNQKYYIPLGIDDNINLTAQENDEFMIDIEYTAPIDSTQFCNSWLSNNYNFVNITKLTKL